MRIIGLAMLFHLSLSCGASNDDAAKRTDCKSIHDTISQTDVYLFVERMPEYPGGMDEALRYFIKNFNYPKQEYFQATFLVEFIVGKDGSVTYPRIKDKKISELTPAEKEVLRVIESMPNWIPGECNGEAVPVLTFMPIR